MPRYTQASKERVRDVVDFVELVSARTDLRRAGPSAYEGLCPFHDERTPSFGIDPSRKLYYCFGCQAKGDVFTFVQDTENVDFTAALELLADRCGVELEREKEDPKEAERRRVRERLWELLARTAAYYERCLWESSEAARAREYLLGRGLREESLREFHVGYAPSAWDRVLTASLRAGFSERELYATGLAQRSSAERGRVYDRFRARIMFPLADVRGRVLGFGARALREDQRPKYLNTSDNDVYHKGAHLYGADLARAHAAKAGRTILCEGYTDVIALHQAGMKNAVGLMGTALTPEQVGGLARMAPTVLLALDADGAGQEAMLRAATLAARRKLELSVIPLPAGADPAELVQREGAAAIERAIGDAIPLARFRVERVLAAGDHGSAEGRERMLQQLRGELASLPQGTMRMELTRVVSERLDLPQSLAERTLAAGAGGDAPPREAPGGNTRGTGDAETAGGRTAARPLVAVVSRGERTERAFLAQCIAEPQEGAQALAAVDPEEHFTNDVLRRAAIHLREHLSDPGAGLAEDDPALAGALAELAVQAAKEQPRPGMLQTQRMQLELARLERRIRAARASGSGEVSALAQQRIEVKREFEQAYERALAETGG
ncbi:MAG TPA: DNA primase [Solirubrobacteraceae bacterium]|jgi:DNA primase|nr:DNA primase [Solirubrobacteraceae bacterium]